MATKGGSFYATALGIGILVSTITSLVCNIISTSKAGKYNFTNYAQRRGGTYIRLSPVPSRSSVSIF